jgi:hypothetical protein
MRVFRFLLAVYKWARSGFKIALNKDKRLATCMACEHLQEDLTCGVCGCYVKVKTKWRTEECPEGKW